MTNEHSSAKKRQPGDQATPASVAMTPDEQLQFEERIVQGQVPDPAAGELDHSDRLTKSGRLNLEQIRDGLEESEKD